MQSENFSLIMHPYTPSPKKQNKDVKTRSPVSLRRENFAILKRVMYIKRLVSDFIYFFFNLCQYIGSSSPTISLILTEEWTEIKMV